MISPPFVPNALELVSIGSAPEQAVSKEQVPSDVKVP